MRITTFVYRIKVWIVDLLCFFRRLPTTAEIHAPYFSQFMSAELAEDFVEGKRELSTDPEWRHSGADDPEEYERWSWSVCGIACFKMVLTARDSAAAALPLVGLAKEAAKHGAFNVTGTSISSLHYAEFCTYVREKYALHARTVRALSVCAMKGYIAEGDFVIASVHPDIRYTKSMPPKRGGHLVLVVGYDAKGMYIHNPSGCRSNDSQERAFVPHKDFRRFFAYRGIVIKSS